MVQLYKSGQERKIELSFGKYALKLVFTPHVDAVTGKPSQAEGAVFESDQNLNLKSQILETEKAEGQTEKEALTGLVQKLLAQAQAKQQKTLEPLLEKLHQKIIAEGLGFSHERYIPYSQRS